MSIEPLRVNTLTKVCGRPYNLHNETSSVCLLLQNYYLPQTNFPSVCSSVVLSTRNRSRTKYKKLNCCMAKSLFELQHLNEIIYAVKLPRPNCDAVCLFPIRWFVGIQNSPNTTSNYRHPLHLPLTGDSIWADWLNPDGQGLSAAMSTQRICEIICKHN